MKLALLAGLFALTLAALASADTCYSNVQSLPASCEGGTLTQDTMSGGCRILTCSNGANSISAKACDKPTSTNPTSFEMYRTGSSGSAPKVCLDGACIQNNGFDSRTYPVCVATPPPVEDTCYAGVRNLQAICQGGTLTSDTWDGCRNLVCSSGSNTIQVKACDKPAATPQYFEMYKQSGAGNGIGFCLGDVCFANTQDTFEQSQPQEACFSSLSEGLISYYPFNGNTQDAHGSFDASNVGAMQVAGKLGGAYRFDQRTDYLDISNSFPQVDEITISYWVRTTDPGDNLAMGREGGKNGWMISRHNSFAETWFTYGTRVFEGKLNFATENNGQQSQYMNGSTTISTGTWKHIVVTYDGSVKRAYVDGVLDVSAPFSGLYYGGNFPTRVGQPDETWSDYRSFLGDIDELAIWDRALNELEISELYNNGAGKAYPFAQEPPKIITDDLAAYYSFDTTDSGAIFDLDYTDRTYYDGMNFGATTSEAAIVRRSLYFDGSDYATVPAELTNSLSEGTIALWVKFDDEADNRNIFGKGVNSGGIGLRSQYAVQLDDVYFILGYGDVRAETNYNPDMTSWHYLVHTWDGSTKKLYVDGVERISAPQTDNTPSAGDLYLGANGFHSFEWLKGNMDELGIWQRALTKEEVDFLYNNGKGNAYPFSSLEADSTRILSIAEPPNRYGAPIVPSYWIAQNFILNTSAQIDSVAVWLEKTGNPIGSAIVRLETSNNGNPSGTLVHPAASISIPVGEITSGKIKRSFSQAIPLSANTEYFVVIRQVPTTASDYIAAGVDLNNPDPNTVRHTTTDGTNWIETSYQDVSFSLYATQGSVCYTNVQSIPATCTGGTITTDQKGGACRTITCTNGADSMRVQACDKPSSTSPAYFELYKQSVVGTSVKEVCVGSTCVSTSGFAKSTNYPICTQEQAINACMAKTRDAQALCSGGTIVADAFDGCRNVTCERNGIRVQTRICDGTISMQWL
jgi:hypothetical protein